MNREEEILRHLNSNADGGTETVGFVVNTDMSGWVQICLRVDESSVTDWYPRYDLALEELYLKLGVIAICNPFRQNKENHEHRFKATTPSH